MTKTIESRQTGTRTVAGTDWPIVDQVQRQEYGGRVEWIVVRALCNGVADGSEKYPTRSAALEAL